jgi:hypothetical protein
MTMSAVRSTSYKPPRGAVPTDDVSTDGALQDDRLGTEHWSLLAFIVRDKRLLFATLAVLVVVAAVATLEIVGPKVTKVGDSTPCSQWGSANDTEQNAYAVLYLREHGAVPGGGKSVDDVLGAINFGCVQAYGSDEEDTVSVLQAIKGQY